MKFRGAVAAERRRLLSISRPAANSLHVAAAVDRLDGQTDGRTDRRTVDRFIDPAATCMRVVSQIFSYC